MGFCIPLAVRWYSRKHEAFALTRTGCSTGTYDGAMPSSCFRGGPWRRSWGCGTFARDSTNSGTSSNACAYKRARVERLLARFPELRRQVQGTLLTSEPKRAVSHETPLSMGWRVRTTAEPKHSPASTHFSCNRDHGRYCPRSCPTPPLASLVKRSPFKATGVSRGGETGRWVGPVLRLRSSAESTPDVRQLGRPDVPRRVGQESQIYRRHRRRLGRRGNVLTQPSRRDVGFFGGGGSARPTRRHQ